MPLVVQKYGGSSVADIKGIRRVARRVVATRAAGNRVVVVVSAMGGTTDALTKMAHEITPSPQRRELDMLLTAGEREAMALVSLAIMHEGLQAVSFTGSQVGIITDRFHSDARIEEIRGDRLRRALRGQVIPIVAGFQGVSAEREITTLGRGGSDVTAVALAAVLGADRCELYKDVDGVHTENPAEFPGVRLVPRLSFEELAELAGSGSEVIHPRACALAEKYRVQLSIRSSFNDKRGTTVAKLEKMEKAFVRAMTHNHKLVRLSLVDVPKKKHCLHQVVTQLAEARVPIVFFNHGVVHGDRFDLSFIIPEEQLAPAKAILARLAKQVRAVRLEMKESLCSVSVVGPGVGSDPEILSGTLETLHRVGVHLDAFSTSETRLSCFMDRKDLRLAAAALLARFRLK
ncbi:MAG: aspartate kinase [candidate division WOR-3 bacterium]|nr:aspartate kinase [candidate division WOR-3 bacterium]